QAAKQERAAKPERAAQQVGHERIAMNSTLTLALVTGQSVADLTPNVMTNLGWSEIRLPAPAYEGDTIYSESRIESLRDSAKRSNVGIMGIKTLGYTQDGTVVIEFLRTVMMYRRGHAPTVVRPRPANGGGSRVKADLADSA
ncbi:MaoC family dehydratase, partial [uncultured Caballeronia sp.]|uniref:MaoC family dehydratase n=1 Tax=uncultured Caballeronia sp. TaxID=1827198 RepID=UPI0035CC8B9E